MLCKKIYFGQELDPDIWNYGCGSIFLAGPRNKKGKSWRQAFIKKVEDSKMPVALLIPETHNQLKGGFNKVKTEDQFKWQHLAMSVASAIAFWYPAGVSSAQSYVEFGMWHKYERIFLGREKESDTKYLEWLLHKEQLLYPAEDMDQLVEMVLHWIKE